MEALAVTAEWITLSAVAPGARNLGPHTAARIKHSPSCVLYDKPKSVLHPLRERKFHAVAGTVLDARRALRRVSLRSVQADAQAVSEETADTGKEAVSPSAEDGNGAAEGGASSTGYVSKEELLQKLVDTGVSSSLVQEVASVLNGREAQLVAQQQEVQVLAEEVSITKDRFLRLNADFDNFRKRSEREKAAIATTVRGEVVEELLPMVDNFERAKDQLKIETEGEQKIDSSYQGIYKQFVELMKGLGVRPVDTVGKPFDFNLHEAIMREESSEYPEGIVIQEFRRGFTIGDKLLRPAMVKVSQGPGPQEAPPVTTVSAVDDSSEEQT
eukprot:TRINITY_DN20384_c0_g1_i1.p1 TRINITY_DN20384_c0_g1~~TRINITY_DN20384_c0_g1_i1.p1  ORF type:complete len:328 (+),score=92.94 TRINITY_DN20384_c0_g1_i1:132-1115(+)